MIIEPLAPDAHSSRETLAQLIALLTTCVQSGASIGFLAPLPVAEATAYWRKVFGDSAANHKSLLVARESADGPIVGSAQIAFETRANGRHRAEVQKVMVLPSHRRRGIAAQLMGAVEELAQRRGVTLLFLDTSEGHGGAREFYATIGYTYVGGIPGYALDPDGRPAKNAIFYKALARAPS
jgi:GNAT superfamily N-acetyltransferase